MVVGDAEMLYASKISWKSMPTRISFAIYHLNPCIQETKSWSQRGQESLKMSPAAGLKDWNWSTEGNLPAACTATDCAKYQRIEISTHSTSKTSVKTLAVADNVLDLSCTTSSAGSALPFCAASASPSGRPGTALHLCSPGLKSKSIQKGNEQSW